MKNTLFLTMVALSAGLNANLEQSASMADKMEAFKNNSQYVSSVQEKMVNRKLAVRAAHLRNTVATKFAPVTNVVAPYATSVMAKLAPHKSVIAASALTTGMYAMTFATAYGLGTLVEKMQPTAQPTAQPKQSKLSELFAQAQTNYKSIGATVAAITGLGLVYKFRKNLFGKAVSPKVETPVRKRIIR
jgi:hypothetical protein